MFRPAIVTSNDGGCIAPACHTELAARPANDALNFGWFDPQGSRSFAPRLVRGNLFEHGQLLIIENATKHSGHGHPPQTQAVLWFPPPENRHANASRITQALSRNQSVFPLWDVRCRDPLPVLQLSRLAVRPLCQAPLSGFVAPSGLALEAHFCSNPMRGSSQQEITYLVILSTISGFLRYLGTAAPKWPHGATGRHYRLVCAAATSPSGTICPLHMPR